VKGQPLDVRSDLFSFGVILAEMVGGKLPFRKASTVETLSAILRDPPHLATDMPKNMTVLLQRLLAKSVEDRYGSVAEARAHLSGLAPSASDGSPLSKDGLLLAKHLNQLCYDETKVRCTVLLIDSPICCAASEPIAPIRA
jgi:serine/threonine protein kinase